LDVIKAVTMFDKAGVPLLGMVQNMAIWECPDCGRTDHIFGEGGVAKEAQKRGIELLAEMPLSLSIRKGADSGMPVVISEPDSLQARTYHDIAKKLIGKAGLDQEITAEE
ncbi:MAG: P-loop NTPase, partial [Candidatus Puniceispirillaceae bacterium]